MNVFLIICIFTRKNTIKTRFWLGADELQKDPDIYEFSSPSGTGSKFSGTQILVLFLIKKKRLIKKKHTFLTYTFFISTEFLIKKIGSKKYHRFTVRLEDITFEPRASSPTRKESFKTLTKRTLKKIKQGIQAKSKKSKAPELVRRPDPQPIRLRTRSVTFADSYKFSADTSTLSLPSKRCAEPAAAPETNLKKARYEHVLKV